MSVQCRSAHDERYSVSGFAVELEQEHDDEEEEEEERRCEREGESGPSGEQSRAV